MPQSPEPFSLDVSERGGAVVLVPRGELDLLTAPEAEAAILEPLRAGRHVVLDLRELAFLDSSGIRVLVEACAVARDDGAPRQFSVVCPPPGSEVHQVLKVSGLDAALEVLDEPPG